MHSEGNHWKWKGNLLSGKIANDMIDKGLIIQYINSSYNLTFPLKTPKTTLFKKWAEDLNRHVSKEGTQMANRHMKDVQHHYHQRKRKSKPQWVITSHLSEWLPQKPTNNKCWQGWDVRTPVHCWWECTLQPVTVENSIEGFSKH